MSIERIVQKLCELCGVLFSADVTGDSQRSIAQIQR